MLSNLGHNLIQTKRLIKGSGNYSFFTAFESLGCEVDLLSLDRKGYEWISSFSPYLWRFFYYHFKRFSEKDNRRFQNNLVQKVKDLNPEIVFIVVGNQILPETIKRISEICSNTLLWIGLDPESAGWTNVINSVPHYTHIFIVDPDWQLKFEKWGAREIFQQDLGVDPSVFHPMKIQEEEQKEYACDLAFVGQWNEFREEFFSSIADYDLGLWGKGWKENISPSSPLYKAIRGPAFGEEVAKIYNCCKIVINTHTRFTKYGINMRTYEAAGCQAFQIVDDVRGIPTLFKEGEEIVIYRNNDDLRSKIDFYLKNDQKREEIGRNSLDRVLRDHTYFHLIGNVLSKVFVDERARDAV